MMKRVLKIVGIRFDPQESVQSLLGRRCNLKSECLRQTRVRHRQWRGPCPPLEYQEARSDLKQCHVFKAKLRCSKI